MIWELLGMFRGEYDEMQMAYLLVRLAARVFVILFCLSMHEFAHAWAAKKLGDDTAWMHGRLTLNPAKHLDLFGTLMILVVGFGYAKPVPVNPRNFKNHKKGMALTAAAGPLSNLIMAIFFCIVTHVMRVFAGGEPGDVFRLLFSFFYTICSANVALMVFNLIPFPPLDGSRILDLVLPQKASNFILQHEHIFRWAVLGLLLFSSPLHWLINLVASGINALVSLPFGLLF